MGIYIMENNITERVFGYTLATPLPLEELDKISGGDNSALASFKHTTKLTGFGLHDLDAAYDSSVDF
jgi:hypothetical protein